MSQNNFDQNSPRSPTDDATSEGGLRAPPGLSPLRRFWWWFDFIILVNLAVDLCYPLLDPRVTVDG